MHNYREVTDASDLCNVCNPAKFNVNRAIKIRDESRHGVLTAKRCFTEMANTRENDLQIT